MLFYEILTGHTLYKKMKLMKEQLIKEIDYIQKIIAQYPEGELFCVKNSAWSKWY